LNGEPVAFSVIMSQWSEGIKKLAGLSKLENSVFEATLSKLIVPDCHLGTMMLVLGDISQAHSFIVSTIQ